MNRTNTLTAALLAGAFGATGAHAQTVANIDFEGATFDNFAYTGDDAALSSPGGTTWNSVLVVGPALVENILDQFGGPTTWDVVLSPNAFPDTDPASTNTLEDSGIGSAFSIKGLNPALTYSVAGYVMTNGGFNIIDNTGPGDFQGFGFDFDMQSYDLPGVRGGGPTDDDGDYMQFDNLVPYDLGGGEYAIDVLLDGTITGFQIREIPSPAAPALGLIAGLAALRRRRTA